MSFLMLMPVMMPPDEITFWKILYGASLTTSVRVCSSSPYLRSGLSLPYLSIATG